MASNGIEKIHRTTGWSSFAYINRNRAKKVAGNRIPAQRVSTMQRILGRVPFSKGPQIRVPPVAPCLKFRCAKPLEDTLEAYVF